MAQGYLHVDLFVKVYVYKCVYCIVLDHLKVETSGDGDECAKASSGECGGVRILLRAGLLISMYHEACLIFLEAPVFVELIDVDPYVVEDLRFLLSDGGSINFKP